MSRLVLFLCLLLGACASPAASSPTPYTLIAAFKAAGLEAENPVRLDEAICEGVRFNVPPLGNGRGGEVWICTNEHSRDVLAGYPRDNHASSTYPNDYVFVKGLAVVRIDGAAPVELARRYVDALP